MQKSGLLTMSIQEVERLTIIRQVVEKQIKQREAGKLLGLSSRQIRRLVKAFRRSGAAGLISKQRGIRSNRRYSEEKKNKIRKIVEKCYRDFSPSFAAEKLREQHKLQVSRETLRQWMIEWSLWKAKRQKQVCIHQSRERRTCFGELIQIDGSPHDWFEGRGPKCCLLVFIDDATSQLVGLRFEPVETCAGYFRVARAYVEAQGIPLAFYSDKYGIFRINLVETGERGETQFGRACRELGIELICANSPQAKGRVERVNGTLQNRLVKELRLAAINDIEAANAFLPTYMQDHNRRFAVVAHSEINAHRKTLPSQEALNLIFSLQEERTLTKNLELSYNNVIYQIKTAARGYRLRGAKVTVCKDLSGQITLLYQGKQLVYTCHEKAARVTAVVNTKQIGKIVDDIVKATPFLKPKVDHPWRQYELTARKIMRREALKV